MFGRILLLFSRKTNVLNEYVQKRGKNYYVVVTVILRRSYCNFKEDILSKLSPRFQPNVAPKNFDKDFTQFTHSLVVHKRWTNFVLRGKLTTFPAHISYKISTITFVSGFVLESFTRENSMKGAVSPSHMKETTNNMTVILC